MDKSADWLVTYARYHRDPRNIATHAVGIPLIVFGIAVLLARLQLPGGIGGHMVLYAAGAIWYVRQGLTVVTVATLLAVGAITALAHPFGAAPLSVWLAAGLGCFVVGWVFQFVGHHWEGRKPAFFDDLRGLFAGPMFVVAEAWFALGGGQALRERIEREAGPVARQTPGRQAGT